MERKIYPSVTTTSNSDWRQMIEDADRFSLKEVGLFLTGMLEESRNELYGLLEKSGIREIPLVHLRDDMDQAELEFLIKRFKTRKFNAHSDPVNVEKWRRSRFRGMVSLENSRDLDDSYWEDLGDFAGVCLDVAHLEDYDSIQGLPSYKDFHRKLKRQQVAWTHISGIRNVPALGNDPLPGEERSAHYHNHHIEDLSELDFLAKHRDLLPEDIAIELENPLELQLVARGRIMRLLGIDK